MIAERSKRPSFLFIIFTCTYCCHNWPLNRKSWSFIMAGEINITLRFSAHGCLHWGINNDKRLCEIHKPWRTFSLHKSCWWPISMRPAKTYAWSCILTFFQLVLFFSRVCSLSWPRRVSTEAWSLNGRTTQTLVSEGSKCLSFFNTHNFYRELFKKKPLTDKGIN